MLSRLLTAVLHLSLAKKQLAWLVRNSRPVMLEPYLRHWQTNVVHKRQMSRGEHRCTVLPGRFVYRRQLLGQMFALACWWLLVGWVLRCAEVWSDN